MCGLFSGEAGTDHTALEPNQHATVHSQQQKPDEIEQRLKDEWPVFNGWWFCGYIVPVYCSCLLNKENCSTA